MHIHGGHLNPNSSLGGANAASSALAARRAEEIRKKLFATSSELDAASSTEGAWMVTAWAGGNAASTPDRSSHGQSESESLNSRPSNSSPSNSRLSESESELEEFPRAAAAGPVSYWA